MSKAQVATFDLFLAVFVFIILLFAVVFIWRDYTLRLDKKLEFDHMQIKAFQISNTLLKNPGTPTAWENYPNEAKVLGLAYKDRVLSQDKVDAFIDLTYNDIKKLFMIDYYDYDFYFAIKNLEGESIKTTGLTPTGNYIINLQRRVLYNNEEAIMEFSLWK